jgi:regulator of chromosome condensation
MPPRRPSRAASTKLVGEEAPAATKATTRSKSQPPKRPASPVQQEGEPAPATKRSRTALKKEESTTGEEKPKPKATKSAPATKATKENGATDSAVKETKSKATASKPAAKSKEATSLKKTTSSHPPPEPPMNALPIVPEHPRPAPQLFGCGVGNFGQLGMGPDQLGEHSKPKRNMLVESQIEEGAYGGEGAGLETIAAGGMHTLFVDEKGTVRSAIFT